MSANTHEFPAASHASTPLPTTTIHPHTLNHVIPPPPPPCPVCVAIHQVDAIDWLKAEINRLEDAILMERDAALV